MHSDHWFPAPLVKLFSDTLNKKIRMLSWSCVVCKGLKSDFVFWVLLRVYLPAFTAQGIFPILLLFIGKLEQIGVIRARRWGLEALEITHLLEIRMYWFSINWSISRMEDRKHSGPLPWLPKSTHFQWFPASGQQKISVYSLYSALHFQKCLPS